MRDRTLQEIIAAAIGPFHTRRAFAKALGLSESHVGRIANGKVTTTDLDTCLILTRFSDATAAEILRAAGHHTFLALIEKHFGPGHARVPVELAPDEAHCLMQLRQLPTYERDAVEAVVDCFASRKQRRTSSGRTRPAGHSGHGP